MSKDQTFYIRSGRTGADRKSELRGTPLTGLALKRQEAEVSKVSVIERRHSSEIARGGSNGRKSTRRVGLARLLHASGSPVPGECTEARTARPTENSRSKLEELWRMKKEQTNIGRSVYRAIQTNSRARTQSIVPRTVGIAFQGKEGRPGEGLALSRQDKTVSRVGSDGALVCERDPKG
jgi:hypothetical protein